MLDQVVLQPLKIGEDRIVHRRQLRPDQSLHLHFQHLLFVVGHAQAQPRQKANGQQHNQEQTDDDFVSQMRASFSGPSVAKLSLLILNLELFFLHPFALHIP